MTLFGSFPFLDTFVSKIRENVSRNRRNDKKCLETGENEKCAYLLYYFVTFHAVFGVK